MKKTYINLVKSTIIILISILFFSACTDTEAELIKAEKALLQEYLTDNNISIAPTESGLYYIETVNGTGNTPVVGQEVEVHYIGTLINGEKFDSSYDRGQPFKFTLGIGQVIKGWDEGISYMKVGTKAKLIIPSDLGYGANGVGNIPPYSTLIFTVELMGIE